MSENYKEMVEALRRLLLDPKDATEIGYDRLHDQWRRARAILDPPKPIGYINAADLPEAGTVYIAYEAEFHLMRVVGWELHFWVWVKQRQGGDHALYSAEKWNETNASYVTAVIPPPQAKKPKIELCTNEQGSIRINNRDGNGWWFRPLTKGNAIGNMESIKEILESAGIDVRVKK